MTVNNRTFFRAYLVTILKTLNTAFDLEFLACFMGGISNSLCDYHPKSQVQKKILAKNQDENLTLSKLQ